MSDPDIMDYIPIIMKNLLIFILLIPLFGSTQVVIDSKRDYIWSLGNFNAPTNRAVFDFSVSPFHQTSVSTPINTFNANSCISDPYGRLLFYTNGWTVCDSTNQVMPNGDSLSLGDYYNLLNSSWYGNVISQGVLSLPVPDNPQQYIIFHEALDFTPSGGSTLTPGLMYSIVDMTLNNGKGDILHKNQRLISDTLHEGILTAVRHANGRDWWILKPSFYKSEFFRILLDPNGLHVTKQTIPNMIMGEINEAGYAVFSPDGQKYIRATACCNNVPIRIEIYSFDRCSGLLSDCTNLAGWVDGNTTVPPSAAVSPNSKYLYINTTFVIKQYDLESSNIESSKIEVAHWDSTLWLNNVPTAFTALQLAPDNKIYISAGCTPYIHVIQNPDLQGIACNVQQRAVTLCCQNDNGLPNFPNFRLGRLVGSPCDTLGTYWGIEDNKTIENISISAFPNPATNVINFELEVMHTYLPMQFQIFDQLGRQIEMLYVAPFQGIINYNVSNLSPGVYFGLLKRSEDHVDSVRFVVE